MASSLKSRLARLRERGEAPRPPPVRRPDHIPAFLSSWERIDEHVYGRSRFFPYRLPESFDPQPFAIRLGRLETAGPPPRPAETRSASSLRFFDFETTGLSGGAGTIAFLAATGRVEKGTLRVDQLFLCDYPGEAAFIRAFVSTLGELPNLVSYNGKSFDWPLLVNRCVMNGVKRPEIALHLDLVHSARRLWRPLVGSASLGDLEVPILGRDRGEDIPGSEIPAVYFSYLENGDDERLDLVASHNLSDVATLASLFAKAEGLFVNPSVGTRQGPVDLRNLGRVLLACGRDEEGEALLLLAAERGDETAALLLARRLRRRGEALASRQALALAGRGYESLLESARLAESLEDDLGAALASAQAAIEAARDAASRNRALARVRRLSIRIAEASRVRPGRRRF